MDIYKLRRNFPRFVYHSYTLDETADQLRLSYHFEIPDLAEFKPSWVFPKTALASQDLDASLAERSAFTLGLCRGLAVPAGVFWNRRRWSIVTRYRSATVADSHGLPRAGEEKERTPP